VQISVPGGVSPALYGPGSLKARPVSKSPLCMRSSIAHLGSHSTTHKGTVFPSSPQENRALHKNGGKKGVCSISTVSISGHSLQRQRQALGSTLCLVLQSEMQQ